MSRILLTSPTQFYVRRDGDNANDGLSDSASGAFETGQGAIDHLAQNYDGGNNTITVNFSHEEHNGGMSLRTIPGSGAVVLNGNVAAPRNCPLFVSNNFPVNYPGGFSVYIVQGFWIKALTAGYSSLRATEKGRLKYAYIDFGQTGHAHVMAGRDGNVFSNGNNTISGGGNCHYYAEQGAFVQEASRVITFLDHPQFTQAFARATQQSRVIIPGNTWTGDVDSTYTPTHHVTSLSYIGTNQQGANYIPGNATFGYEDTKSMLD